MVRRLAKSRPSGHRRVRASPHNEAVLERSMARTLGDATALVRLQRSVGNAAVSRLVVQRRKNIDQHYDLPLDENGHYIGPKGKREPHAAKAINARIRAGEVKVVGGEMSGGHLLKAEFGGVDSPANVVPWAKGMEKHYGAFEADMASAMKRHAGWVKEQDREDLRQPHRPSRLVDKAITLEPQSRVAAWFHFHTDALFRDWGEQDVEIEEPRRSDIPAILNDLSDIPWSVASTPNNSDFGSWNQRQITNGVVRITKDPAAQEVPRDE